MIQSLGALMRSLTNQSPVSVVPAIAIVLAVGVVGCSSSVPKESQSLPITAEVELGGRTIKLEVAQTPEEQAIGVMFRESLADDRGMLFPVDPPRPVQFWMKNVEIPLDLLFITEGEIVAIESNVPPCLEEPCPTYGPEGVPVDAAIEVRGGLAEDLRVEVGTAVDVEALSEPSE
ncbi:MAG: DUF192 domain-containing protein [Cyanobacteria bacterium J06639_14]